MRRFIRVGVTVLLSASVLAAGGSTPAAAVTGGLIIGRGAIAPGLTALPKPQAFNFVGTATVGGAVQAYGTDLAGTIAQGMGFLRVLCDGHWIDGAWNRVGADVTVALASSAGNAGGGHFTFVPDQVGAPPEAGGTTVITSYSLIGTGICA